MELMVVRVWVQKQLLLRVDWAELNLPSPKNWWLYFKDEPGLGCKPRCCGFNSHPLAQAVPLTTQLLRPPECLFSILQRLSVKTCLTIATCEPM